MEFQERFATEEACREYLFASRWPDGFVCPACGFARAGEMHRRRLLWQCKECGQQTSATAGTVMHATRMPLRTWFWAAYLVATHHPGISAKQLQRLTYACQSARCAGVMVLHSHVAARMPLSAAKTAAMRGSRRHSSSLNSTQG
ncbi:MAG: IS1595 family transposase [Gaiellaceae bacterium]